jgi:hypothetical protein
MPIDIIIGLGIKALIGAIVVTAIVAILSFNMIVDWFRDRTTLKEQDKQHIAFTLQEHLSNGNVKTVQGIFNTRNKTLIDSKGYESRDVDPELAEIHRGEELVIYQ